MRRPAALFAIGAICAISAVLAIGQQSESTQNQTFRTGVDLVQVDVSVLDARRRPIRGLTAADFTIFEDGRPVPIAAFAPVEIPLAAPAPPGAASWLREIAPDTTANDLPREGRAIVIMIDYTLQRRFVPTARKIAAATIDALGPTDIAAVVHVASGEPQGFTRDKARLRAATTNLFAGLSDAEAAFAAIVPGGAAPLPHESDQRGQCPQGACTLDAITRVADALRDVPRRKVLLLITNDVAVEVPNESAEHRRAREAMLRALDNANLSVSVVDPTGLETLALDASRPSLARPSPDRTAINEKNLVRYEGLRYLPARTGGQTIANSNDPDALVADVLDETSAYYMLGFRPNATTADGRLHAIDVRVRGGGKVHARRAFYPGGASRPAVSVDAGAKLPQPLRDALGGNWPSSDLRFTVTAAPFADPSGARSFATIAIAAERTGDIGSTALVDVLVEAFDRDGRSVNYHHQSLDIGDALKASGSSRFEIYSRLPLDAGRYELRAGILDGASRRVGTVHTHIDMPDFSRAPLSMSGIVVEALPGSLAAPPALFADIFDLLPTTRRIFARSDTVTALARIYQAGDRPQPVTLVIRTTDAAGKDLRNESRSIRADEFTGKHERGFNVSLPVPVEDLSPGEYLLTIEATSGNRTEQRPLRFTVK